jgi:FMN-dependent NADH-azoreductase
MTHILHLDASPRGDRSVSRILSHEFIADWKAAYPDDTIVYRDLGHHPVPFVTEDWIAAAHSAPEQHTPAQAQAIQLLHQRSVMVFE